MYIVIAVVAIFIVVMLDILIKRYLEVVHLPTELVFDWEEIGIVVVNSANVAPDKLVADLKQYELDSVIVESTVKINKDGTHIVNNAQLMKKLAESGINIYAGLVADYFNDDKTTYSAELLSQQITLISSMKVSLGKRLKGFYLHIHETSLLDSKIINNLSVIGHYLHRYGSKFLLAITPNINQSREDMIRYMGKAMKLGADMLLLRIDLAGTKIPLFELADRIRLVNSMASKYKTPVGVVILVDPTVPGSERIETTEHVLDEVRNFIHVLFVGDYSNVNKDLLQMLKTMNGGRDS